MASDERRGELSLYPGTWKAGMGLRHEGRVPFEHVGFERLSDIQAGWQPGICYSAWGFRRWTFGGCH